MCLYTECVIVGAGSENRNYFYKSVFEAYEQIFGISFNDFIHSQDTVIILLRVN